MPAKLHKLDQSSQGRAAMMACGVFNFPVEMDDGDVVIKNPETDETEILKVNLISITNATDIL